MRKSLKRAALLAVVAFALLLALRDRRLHEHPAEPEPPPPSAAAVERPGAPLAPPQSAREAATAIPEAERTPPLEDAVAEVDGLLEVRVVAQGRPVPRAQVRLYWRGAKRTPAGEVEWRTASKGATGDDGRLVLAARPGAWLVAVRAEGYAPVRRLSLRPEGGERTVLEIPLESPGVPLEGRVVARGGGTPLEGAQVTLTPWSGPVEPGRRAEAPVEERVTSLSDAQGRFHFQGLSPGAWRLEASAPGHARVRMHAVEVPATGAVGVALEPSGVVEGRVLLPDGTPAATAEVRMEGHPPVLSDAQGRFSLEVAPGVQRLSARRETWAGALEPSVVVEPGQHVEALEVRLGLGARLEGTVVSRAGQQPVVGAEVWVVSSSSRAELGRTVTDGRGSFEVAGLPPGTYEMAVEAPGFSGQVRQDISLGAAESISLRLALEGRGGVEGQVLDDRGLPVPDAWVRGGTRWGSLGLPRVTAETRTDAEGRYRLEGLGVGSIFLQARRDGMLAARATRVESGRVARVDFTLEPEAPPRTLSKAWFPEARPPKARLPKARLPKLR